ncbi:YybH family protein [Pseudonocardia adelaidensis]|uniref:Nuclear transport factor 2 family protein n=1 Tax=Pseudonocardia adelaidensis TaxID=648754 RepID=A0ABP9NMP0_9PSEU
MITLVDHGFGPDARNRLDAARDPGPDGAVAALETFYFALNNARLDVLRAVWSPDPLAQLNNPVGGILRSGDAIAGLYGRIFAGGLDVQVTFTDAATYLGADTAVFAGRELGSYLGPDGGRVPLQIRTSRVFTWHPDQGSWLQTHHHGSIDDPEALAAYQAAARR